MGEPGAACRGEGTAQTKKGNSRRIFYGRRHCQLDRHAAAGGKADLNRAGLRLDQSEKHREYPGVVDHAFHAPGIAAGDRQLQRSARKFLSDADRRCRSVPALRFADFLSGAADSRISGRDRFAAKLKDRVFTDAQQAEANVYH